ncbi:MAG TPA: long-chain fatty acid--CoA ligase [Acidimicrobiia bacterium]
MSETVTRQFVETVRAFGARTALRWKVGDGFGEWTWDDYAAQATRLAGALGELGIGAGDRVVLLMRNRPEFHVADIAVMLCGATPISIYNSSAADQIHYLAGHCGAVAAIVEDGAYLDRLLSVRSDLAALRHVVVIDDPPAGRPAGVLSWSELLGHAPVDLDAAAGIAKPSDLATVIYTSGTTGPPKGVMLDHANIEWTVDCYRAAVEVQPGWRAVSYLPMAHIAERMSSHYLGIATAFEVTTCPDPGQVVVYLGAVRPQTFFAVPRVWEKAYASLHSVVAADPAKAADFERALDVGWEVSELRARGEEPAGELAARFEVAEESLGFVRELIGLDQAVICVTGAAPIPFEILRFFRALGLPLSEIYGLSETSGPMTWTPFRVRVGTVGPPMPGIEVKLAEDGEVLCRGGNVFRGYLDAPDKTAEVLDPDGWFHSGDIGTFDDAGYLRIVDRKKEIIITAGGKNISPANLEAALKAGQLIGQACAIGNDRPFVSALIVLDPDSATLWARRHGIDEPFEELAANAEVQAEVQREVDAANAGFSQVERIKRFTLLSKEWLPDSEELTPTMKLKRRGVHTKYAAEIDALYA